MANVDASHASFGKERLDDDSLDHQTQHWVVLVGVTRREAKGEGAFGELLAGVFGVGGRLCGSGRSSGGRLAGIAGVPVA